MPYRRFRTTLMVGVGLLVLCAMQPLAAHAQEERFVLIQSTLPQLSKASVDAADYDGDGQPDLLLTGTLPDGNPSVHILRFRDEMEEIRPPKTVIITARYTPVAAVLRPVTRGIGRWIDYDQDGDLDLFIAGLSSEGGLNKRTAEFYTNVGPTFVPDSKAVFAGVEAGAVDWGDFDGDGDLDLILAGLSDNGPISRIYRNDKGIYTDIRAGLSGIMSGSVAWGDYDGDGDPDVLLCGRDGQNNALTHIYRNDGGAFLRVSVNLEAVYFGSAHWGDYDGDGDLDVLVGGGKFDPAILRGTLRVYRNDGGQFVPQDVGVAGAIGTVQWADYDGDGDLDILVMGASRLFEEPALRVYENDGQGRFTLGTSIGGLDLETTVWFDYNGDGDLDVISIGQHEGAARTYFLKNMLRP